MNRITLTDSAKRSTRTRLQDALSELGRRQPSDGTSTAPTATELCRLAGVSRNALYRYHPKVLHELHQLQRKYVRSPGSAKMELVKLQEENSALRERVNKLAALVDHYYAAWHESNTLLERREREIADLRKNSKLKPVSLRK